MAKAPIGERRSPESTSVADATPVGRRDASPAETENRAIFGRAPAPQPTPAITTRDGKPELPPEPDREATGDNVPLPGRLAERPKA